MPKETFYHLNSDKKEKIEKALEMEFSRVSLEKASISNIIKEANIPRGSFYQYFEDKEDAIKYIMQKYMSIEKNTMKRFLDETNGDIFETSLKIFDYMISKGEESKWNLYKNILQEIKKNNISLLDGKMEHEEVMNKTNIQMLNIKEKDDFKYIMKIISTITRTASIDVTSGKLLKEEARSELKKQLEILKRGMLKL